MPDEVELFGWSAEPCERRGEPVTVGVPWPRGVLRDAEYLACIGPDGEVPLQTEVLERWPDGSVRWVLCDTLLNTKGNGATGYRLKLSDSPSPLRRGGRGVRSGLPIRIQLDELESSDVFELPEPNLVGRVESSEPADSPLGLRRVPKTPPALQDGPIRIRTPFHFRGHSESKSPDFGTTSRAPTLSAFN